MHNGNKPNPDELPSSAQLIKSTILAAVAAAVILVTVVLPSEYGIDPTGIGKAIGLAEMGEIKVQLAEEAEADRLLELQNPGSVEEQSSLGGGFFSFFVGAAHAQTTEPEWTDQYSVTLTPGEGIEVKLVMEVGAEAEFLWVAENGVVNFDLHGDGGGNNISYEKGRAVAGDEGVLTAAFTGNHGWFWRNRDGQDVTVTLFVRGDYSEMKLP
ncbi:MAG: transmembrane anchor protein [Roseovarius sp.]|jgi:hypothetical protein|nr:transmembrane anchor protein [Roseovarius sp.]